MSGGHYYYVYLNIQQLADQIKINNMPHRVAFVDLLNKVAKAAKAIEWVDSGDYAEGDEIKAIEDIFESHSTLVVKAAAYDQIVDMIKKLNNDESR